MLMLLIASVAGAGVWIKEQLAVSTSRVHAAPTVAADGYDYYILKAPQGFALARALKGEDGQPLAAPQPLTVLGNGFGQIESDSVTSLQLSPDKLFLAISGVQDHGDTSWIFDTQTGQIRIAPEHVQGNFLRWIPGGHTFLYRPMFPLDSEAPMDGNAWNPGLWIVDAATGAHTNLAIGMPAAYLADAAASPDGARVIYSTTQGIGMGSDTWLMSKDGKARKLLFHSTGSGQSIAGLFAWSPDGKRIAYERIADSNAPFQVAGLWVMDSDGGRQLRVGDADGGHGYAPVWSPDSQKIAFIVRTNSADKEANTQAQALQSGIGVVNLATNSDTNGRNNRPTMVASVRQTGVQWNTNPTWGNDSASITFIAQNPANRVLGGNPRYYIAYVTTGGLISLFAQKSPVQALTPVLSHVVAASS
jgi:dipeptidyl aminopeptidase/acylaminoacyl peptidase